MPAIQADRRPAIWPWLVMPLIALSMFYCLDRLRQQAQDRAAFDPPRASQSPADPETP